MCKLCSDTYEIVGNMQIRKKADGYHLYICHELYALSLYSDEPVFANGESDVIKFCPLCGNELK